MRNVSFRSHEQVRAHVQKVSIVMLLATDIINYLGHVSAYSLSLQFMFLCLQALHVWVRLFDVAQSGRFYFLGLTQSGQLRDLFVSEFLFGV
jgi:hypothetical protein